MPKESEPNSVDGVVAELEEHCQIPELHGMRNPKNNTGKGLAYPSALTYR